VPSRRDKSFLDLALRVAESSDCKQQHGAVVVKGGRVMAVGVNKFRNDPAFVPSDTGNRRGTIFSVHAEVSALSRVANPRGCTIYIARVSNGASAFSRPCDNCVISLMRAGVKSICYT